MIVHWPNARPTHVSMEQAARAQVIADLCPRRDEHTSLPRTDEQKRMVATIHPLCGLPVIWKSKKQLKERPR